MVPSTHAIHENLETSSQEISSEITLQSQGNLIISTKHPGVEHSQVSQINNDSDITFTVCGDTHGQYYDLLNIFELNGIPSRNRPYLFNGDYVDRGSFSVEVVVALLAWKVCDPTIMHLTRGNHESKTLNKLYGYGFRQYS